jgi:hypothetical protein
MMKISHWPDVWRRRIRRARTVGTFSYIGGFVTFLTVMLYLGIALMASASWKFKGNALPLCLIVATLGAMFTTGSRTPFYGLFLTAPVLLWMWTVGGIMSDNLNDILKD